MKITQETVFVVSGGARGITASCVVEMARQFKCRFILIGRTAYSYETPQAEPAWAVGIADRPELQKAYVAAAVAKGDKPHPNAIRREVDNIISNREIRGTLQHIHESGGQAIYVSADITNRWQLDIAIRNGQTQLGRVTGILHGAGNLADKRIENKTPADFDSVYGAKIEGLKNLLASVPPEQLDYLILFSSAAGFYGNIGQADYAIANEILNKVAHYMSRTYPRCRVHALNWGPWEGGMVTPEIRRAFAERNIQVIPVDVGTQVLIETLRKPTPTQTLIGGAMHSRHVDPGHALRSHTIRRHMTLEASPALKHHRIGKHAVLPVLHALNWVASACEDLYPGYHFFRCEDCRVLKGIVFDQNLAPEHLLTIREIEKNTEQITFECLVHSQTLDGKPRYHYRMRLMLRQILPLPPHYPDVNLSEEDLSDAAILYEDGTLFHGPYFQGIRKILNISKSKFTLECVGLDVPLREQGQFSSQAIDPFTCDVSMQAPGIWGRKIYGRLGLPSGCEVGEHYRLIPKGLHFYVSLDIRQSSDSQVLFNLTAHDAAGLVYLRVQNGQITMSNHLGEIFQPYSLQAAL